jgi:hypothetical protein
VIGVFGAGFDAVAWWENKSRRVGVYRIEVGFALVSSQPLGRQGARLVGSGRCYAFRDVFAQPGRVGHDT